MKARHGCGVAALLALSVLIAVVESQQVVIDHVYPSRGSLAGGTRMLIRGSGFSSNLNNVGNLVLIGGVKCDVIPLHSTVNQIACKTNEALYGSWGSYRGRNWYLGGQTPPLDVTVLVDGVYPSVCRSNDDWMCTFRFMNAWYHSPLLGSLSPSAVSTGTVITVSGVFHPNPFDWQEIRAPHQEVPLASVKVVNRKAELSRSNNEPFGPSGTRCALFDPVSEQPYGMDRDDWNIWSFQCAIGAREGGRYNFSVALLGSNNMPETEMHMGEAIVNRQAYTTDHEGISFMMTQMAVVTSVSPTTASPTGGALITISGSSFSNDPAAIQVEVAGVLCEVIETSLNKIVCRLGAATDQEVEGQHTRPLGRGIHMQLWYDEGKRGSAATVIPASMRPANVSVDLLGRFEAPVDVGYARGEGGPAGFFEGYFRAPATSKYTFIIASDDDSELWIGENSSNLTRVINFNSYCLNRDYTLLWETSDNVLNALAGANRHKLRQSSPVHMNKGDFLFLRARYRSEWGGDHFSLAAKMHTSPKRRKDHPSAVDERQLISLSFSAPTLETHELSLVPTTADTNLTGTFTLSVGGKVSRAIRANASALEVAAALRELFGNCADAVGDVLDAAGNSMDCFQGRGLQYRGFANKAWDGTPCLNWRDAQNWHPWLALDAGLDANFCRNPDWDLDVGVWCYTSSGKKRCNVDRCGGGQAVDTPMVQTFEDEEIQVPGRSTLTWQQRDGVFPKIETSTAFCGRQSLYFPNSFSHLPWKSQQDKSKPNDNSPYGLDQYPYLCMAYKIPPTSRVAMLLRVRGCNITDQGKPLSVDPVTQEKSCITVDEWVILDMTEGPNKNYFGSGGSWGVIADNQWHYTCIDVFHSFQQNDFVVNYLRVTDRWQILQINFWNDEGLTGGYGTDSFWIDEFSIGRTARNIRRTEYPSLGNGRVLRLAGVEKREEQGGGASWTVKVTYENCNVAAEGVTIGVDASLVSGGLSNAPTSMSRTQTHSHPPRGGVKVAWGGQAAEFDAQASADTVKNALAPVIGESEVLRVGTCVSGYSWMVTFKDQYGDQDLMSVDFSATDGAIGNDVTASIASVENGGLVLGPIPADYMYLPQHAAGVRVSLYQGAAKCEGSGCAFVYDPALAPTVSSAEATPVPDQTFITVNIVGAGLATPAGPTAVKVDGVICNIVEGTATRIQCNIEQCIPAGTHVISVLVPDRGYAKGDATVSTSVFLSSVSPATVRSNAPTVLTLSGSGFNDIQPFLNVILIGSERCTVLTATCRRITCLHSPSTSGGRRQSSTDISASVGDSNSTINNGLSVVDPPAPTVTSVSPTMGSAGGGTRVMVIGTYFSSNSSGNTVRFGGVMCDVEGTPTPTEIICITRNGAVATVKVVVETPDGTSANDVSFENVLHVSLVGPSSISIGGGINISVSGEGFVAGSQVAKARVEAYGRETYALGFFAPPLFREVQDIVLKGSNVYEIQRIMVNRSFEDYFTLELFGNITNPLPRNINSYALKQQVDMILPSNTVSRVVLNGEVEPNLYVYDIEFRGFLGDVPMLLVNSSTPDSVNVSEFRKGLLTRGELTISESSDASAPTSSNFDMWANSDEIETAINSAFHPNNVTVHVINRPATPANALRTLRITFNQFTGIHPMLLVTADAAFSDTGGTAEVTRVTPGTGYPVGNFKLLLSGRETTTLTLQATESQVEDAIKNAFPELADVSVVEINNYPGKLIGRVYPMQWAISFSRAGVAGLGPERCLDPRYIDWDPSACPQTAPDLYLTYFPYYWPTALTRPADVDSENRRALLSRLCEVEARNLLLISGVCNALIPPETLPMCGVGSGTTPPCWETRFTTAVVVHQDNTEVRYVRDDTQKPTDSTKGFRFWRRLDLEALMQAQTLRVNYTATIEGYSPDGNGALCGLHVDRVNSRAASTHIINASSVVNTSFVFTAPSQVRNARSLAHVIAEDYYYLPAGLYRLGSFQTLGDSAVVNVKKVPGALLQDEDGAAGIHTDASKISLPFSTSINTPLLSVELWVRVTVNPQTGYFAPLVRSLGSDGTSGYVLGLKDLKFAFMLGLGGVSGIAQESKTGMLVLEQSKFSVLSSSENYSLATWYHVAGTYDGILQKIYVDGVEQGSASPSQKHAPNLNGNLVFGAGCETVPSYLCNASHSYCADTCNDRCSGSNCSAAGDNSILVGGTFRGALDEAIIYTRALSAHAVRAHASAANDIVRSIIGAIVNGAKSMCDQASSCKVVFSASHTPSLTSVDPQSGPEGSKITIIGRNFAADMKINMGDRECILDDSPSSSDAVCTIGTSSGLLALGYRNISVFVPGKGLAINTLQFDVVAGVVSVSPALVSRLGGANLTITGVGFPDVTAVRVSVGSAQDECTVSSSSTTQIVCLMQRAMQPFSDGQSLRVNIFFNGQQAYCPSSSSVCTIMASSSATYALTSITPTTVSAGITLTIAGTLLPTSPPPIVHIGTTPCTLLSSADSEITCQVMSGTGGRSDVSVLFAEGYAVSSQGMFLPHVTYSIAVDSVTPLTSTEADARLITLTGSGFSLEPYRNRVYVEGQPARVVASTSTSITVLTPTTYTDSHIGAEQALTSLTGATTNLGTCLGTMLSLDSTVTNTISDGIAVVALPNGLGDVSALTDGDKNTVWYSQPGLSQQVLVLDFGTTLTGVRVVRIFWEGSQTSTSWDVAFGSSSCSQVTALTSNEVTFTNQTVMGSAVKTATITASAGASGQFVVLTLRWSSGGVAGVSLGLQSMRIRDVVVDTYAALPRTSPYSAALAVYVDGAYATCSACDFTFHPGPQSHSLSTNHSRVGSNLTVTFTHMDDNACANNILRIGEKDCVANVCNNDQRQFICSVPSISAGVYNTYVYRVGQSGMRSNVMLTVHPSVTGVQPNIIGMGGGDSVTLFGSGFPPNITASVCGEVCNVTAVEEGQVLCTSSRIGSRLDGGESGSISAQVKSGADDAYEISSSGIIVADQSYLGFTSIRWQQPLEKAYMRFFLDIPHNSTITNARMHFRAERASCTAGSVLNFQVEDTDSAGVIQDWKKGSLSSRPMVGQTISWTVENSWRWPVEDEESVDISPLIGALVRRSGWREGNAVMVKVWQNGWAGEYANPCRILSYEAGAKYAPVLKVQFTAPYHSIPSEMACDIQVTAKAPVPSALTCTTPAQLSGLASADSESVPASKGGLAKEAYVKSKTVMNFMDSVNLCARHGATLCTADQIFDGSVPNWVGPGGVMQREPFFGPVVTNLSLYTPVLALFGQTENMVEAVVVQLTNPGAGTLVKWSEAQNVLADASKIDKIACCSPIGHPARLAADGNDVSFWRSATDAPRAVLTVDLVEPSSVMSVDVIWGNEYARSYGVSLSSDGVLFKSVLEEHAGVGGSVSVWIQNDIFAAGVRFVRVEMRERATPTTHSYSVREVRAYGCSRTQVTELAVSTQLNASRSASPTITSITPDRGSTAGGTDVTIFGSFGTGGVSVTIGGFACTVGSNTVSNIICRTSASGSVNGGVKYVEVQTQSNGVALGNVEYWYIDTWSARTTWGGANPPAGCGPYKEDKECMESVVIPAGQTIVLDVSPPRLYLILIEGTLIFDRKDLHLQAHYILLRGGTLQIGTELEPFEHKAEITLYGHPKTVELPTFGAKVIACYECTLSMHGTPQVSWTQLSNTTLPGQTYIKVLDAVQWPIGSKIVIATTDFESANSSHTEVATVAGLADGGKTIQLTDIRVCSTYSLSGEPSGCVYNTSGLTFPHLGETQLYDGKTVAFRAEVGLLSRNIIVRGDHDDVLCPNAQLADDGVTRLSCNQFGVQLFFHSPGHESLRVRLSNVEVANGGQAFRLGRYPIHWHMIGNVRESFQRNCSIHHAWNRGTAIHGTHYLRLEHTFIYYTQGHAFFVEDGVEEYNVINNNLGIKVVPSMNLLNTDQTPAVFWITTMKQYITNNHAVASDRYGLWVRPERSATGTSAGTPMEIHPTNIPVLLFSQNTFHSNGKYGLRIYDVYQPNANSVFQDTLTWRNGKSGWTATVVGKVGFDGIVAVQNGKTVFESRATTVTSWDSCFIRNGLFVDQTALPLGMSYANTEDQDDFVLMGGPMEYGLLLPWNEEAGGGLSVINCTFINFQHACMRACAHCGLGGAPSFGDGGFETRFQGMKFINSPQRAAFRHPNEGFLYDLDGTLTGTGIVENYTKGGGVRGSSFVGISPLIPPSECANSSYSTEGTGGAICRGLIFRRMWYLVKDSSNLIGKALCVRPSWAANVNRCQTLGNTCNCLPYLKMADKGNMWLAAEGVRYEHFMDLQTYELQDVKVHSVSVKDAQPNEVFKFTMRLLSFSPMDKFMRNLFWVQTAQNRQWPVNYVYNTTACSLVGCGQIYEDPAWASLENDERGAYTQGVAAPGNVPVPMKADGNGAWAWRGDANGTAGLMTYQVVGSTRAEHRNFDVRIWKCPKDGCWPPPPPPPLPPPDTDFSYWSKNNTWVNLTNHVANPFNEVEFYDDGLGSRRGLTMLAARRTSREGVVWAKDYYAELTSITQQDEASVSKMSNDERSHNFGRRKLVPRVVKRQSWAGATPGAYDDVWIPPWKRVLLDTNTPHLGHVIVEGLLVINCTANFTATYLELKGGTLIIATVDTNGTIIGSFEGTANIILTGTNAKLEAIHGGPRDTPRLFRGKEGVQVASGALSVMGSFIAIGKKVQTPWALLDSSVARDGNTIVVDRLVDWAIGNEIAISPTEFDAHEAETRTITDISISGGKTTLALNAPLNFSHSSGQIETYGTRSIRRQAEVVLLSRNIIIKGVDEGEALDYRQWNSAKPAANPGGPVCGNSFCEFGVTTSQTETEKSCPQDCRGPQWEYGAAIGVDTYTEDYIQCDKLEICDAEYIRQRRYVGSMSIADVEMRYFGQNNIRAGVTVNNVSNVSISSVAFNRGYFSALHILKSNKVSVTNSTFYRSILPTIWVDQDCTSTSVTNNVGILGIFWNTHRGAIQGQGIAEAKTGAMIGMFHDQGVNTVMNGNRAAGSERAGFSGHAVPCTDGARFVDNVAHSALHGYHFDHYKAHMSGDCILLPSFTAWKMWSYGVYGEFPRALTVKVQDARISDAKVGVLLQLGGAESASHVRKDMRSYITDSLFVGRGDGQGSEMCTSHPTLHTCTFYMSHCGHVGPKHIGIMMSNYMSKSNMAPVIHPWDDAGSYPALYGATTVERVTFANYGIACGVRDVAIAGNKAAPDAWHFLTVRQAEMVQVDADSATFLDPPNPGWINQADCIDMDCDGPRESLIRDEDGTFLGGSQGAVFSRGEIFSNNSYFGIRYGEPINVPVTPWWYPNLPILMRTDRKGNPVNVQQAYLSGGFGIKRPGCTLSHTSNAWRCVDTGVSYRQLVLENLDADNEIRRISPVALTSSDGYTSLLNGCQDHGWCFSYTCLKRLMTFWAVVAMDSTYTFTFSGTEPQNMRLSLLEASTDEMIIIRIYTTQAMRWQVFQGTTYKESINQYQGQYKSQLFKDGKVPANNGNGGWTDQQLSRNCSCLVGSVCFAQVGPSPNCALPSNEHGANNFNRADGMVEIVMRGHDINNYIDVRGMPVVQMTMNLATTVADFYKVKDTFISNLANVLGIPLSRLSITDVVAGNARRAISAAHRALLGGARRSLLESNTVSVSVEVAPDAVIGLASTSVVVLESASTFNVSVNRGSNIMGDCACSYTVKTTADTTAVAGSHFVSGSGTVVFNSLETEKTIPIQVLSLAGYSPDVTFVVELSSPINATLGTPMEIITIKNVHPPAPSAPVFVSAGTNATQVVVSWNFNATWTDAPEGSAGQVTDFTLQCKKDSGAYAAVTLASALSTTATYMGLTAYTRVNCKVRANVGAELGSWSEDSTDMYSSTVCGDATMHGSERCDDGNIVAGDGCSSSCTVEQGYFCSNTGGAGTCAHTCGDQILQGSEECDDGGYVSGDGCDDACRMEVGWQCPGNVCSTFCGDGHVRGSEACDDGDLLDGDGCSASCVVESQWTCNGSPSVCQKCGNGVREGTEVCDDPASPTACVSSCATIAPGWWCGDNGTTCTLGPAKVTRPTSGSVTTSSMVFSWAQPTGYGLPVVNYTLQYANSSSQSSVYVELTVVGTTSYKLENLTANTAYVARVRACHAQGCGSFSPYTLPTYTLPMDASSSLAGMEEVIAAAVTSENLGFNITSINISMPPAAPQAPDESSNFGLLNQSQIEDIIGRLDPSQGFDLQNILDAIGNANSIKVGFVDSSYNVINKDKTVILSVQLTDSAGKRLTDTSSVLTVVWSVTDGTAKSGVDYGPATGGVLNFGIKEVLKSIEIPILENSAFYGAQRTFTVSLSNPTGGSPYELSLNPTAMYTQVYIADPRPGITGAFSETRVSGSGQIKVPVYRENWPDVAVRMVFRTYDITGKNGSDYVGQTEGVVSMPAGVMSGNAVVNTIYGGHTTIEFGVRIVRFEVECSIGSGDFLCSGRIGAQNECVIMIGKCGDGKRTGQEQCDDANTVSYDGCSATCTVEAGFECSGGGGASADVCTLPKKAPEGKAFVLASARLIGVSPQDFQSDETKRGAFLRGVASALSVDSIQVLIEQSQRRALNMLSRRLLASSDVVVKFRILVSAGAAVDMAQKLKDAAFNGAMATSLRAQGLVVDFVLTESPSVLDSSGNSKTLDEINAQATGSLNNRIIIAATVGGGGLVLIVAAMFLIRRHQMRKQRMRKHSPSSPFRPSSPHGALVFVKPTVETNHLLYQGKDSRLGFNWNDPPPNPLPKTFAPQNVSISNRPAGNIVTDSIPPQNGSISNRPAGNIVSDSIPPQNKPRTPPLVHTVTPEADDDLSVKFLDPSNVFGVLTET